ncbi:calcium-binding protein, partial [bacterium]|nr:calcium-binding protein [bacterium]
MAIKKNQVVTVDLSKTQNEDYAGNKKVAINFIGADSLDGINITTDGNNLYFYRGETLIGTVKNSSKIKSTKFDSETSYTTDLIAQSVKYIGEYIPGKKGKVSGSKYNDELNFSDSEVYKSALNISAGAGNDTITATALDDTITGGSGTNIINVYTDPSKKFGNDTVVLTKGENLQIRLADMEYSEEEGNETWGFVNTEFEGKDLKIKVYSEHCTYDDQGFPVFDEEKLQGTITVKNYLKKDVITSSGSFYITDKNDLSFWDVRSDYKDVYLTNTKKYNASWVVEQVWADKLEVKDKKGNIITQATEGFEKVKGANVNLGSCPAYTNTFIGSIYSDTVKGGNSYDDVGCSLGNDVFTLGKGQNTIHYNKNFSHDTINLTKEEQLDLWFNSPSLPTATYTQGTGKNKNDLNIETALGTLTLKKYYGKDTGANVTIHYWDGSEWKAFNLKEKAFFNFNENNLKKGAITTSALADNINMSGLATPIKVKKGVEYGASINAGSGNDSITGTDFNDTIKCGDGQDSVFAGKGDDKIYLEKGENILIFEAGNGNDIVYSGKGNDTLRFDDIDLNTLTFSQGTKKNNKDLIIQYSDTDSVTVKNYYKVNKKGKITGINTKNSVKNITSNGANIFIGTKEAEDIDGSEGRDIIYANGGEDTIRTTGGDDVIYLGSGNSTVKVNMAMVGETPWSSPEYPSYEENCTKTIYMKDDTVLT